MTARKSFILYLVLAVLTSCGKTIKLAEKDFRWIPYKGNETLVFSSTTGDTDTIFLLGTDRQTAPSDPLDIFPTNLEHFTIAARISDPSPPSGNHRYLGSEFLKLSASKYKSSYLSLRHTGKNARFYGGSLMKLEDLDTVQLRTLSTKLMTYHDIIFLYPDSDEYADRSDFITIVYWSKSEGLIRYDKKDSVYWELTNKYPQ